jgi:hypothetical protein
VSEKELDEFERDDWVNGLTAEEQMPMVEKISIVERVTLWEDHAHRHGYRPTLQMLLFEDGTAAIELNVHGRVTRERYVFPFMERDRL